MLSCCCFGCHFNQWEFMLQVESVDSKIIVINQECSWLLLLYFKLVKCRAIQNVNVICSLLICSIVTTYIIYFKLMSLMNKPRCLTISKTLARHSTNSNQVFPENYMPRTNRIIFIIKISSTGSDLIKSKGTKLILDELCHTVRTQQGIS